VSDASSALRDEIDEIVRGAGFSIVELHTSVVKGRTHVHLVVYRPEGVGIDDIAEVHKTVRPRLELLLDDRDVALQVASPGIDRTIKDNSEFAVFLGRGVKVLERETGSWLGGILRSVDERGIEIETAEETRRIDYAEIQKAKLDYTQEVR
jgi:ribosome maturation factor RimP